MSDNLIIFLLFAAVFLGGAAINQYAQPYDQSALIKECQKEMPRNQTCILIAVPKEK